MNGKRIVERKKEGRQGERAKKGGEKKKCKSRAKRGRKKKRGGKKKKKKSSPQNRIRVPLMNGHNDRLILHIRVTK